MSPAVLPLATTTVKELCDSGAATSSLPSYYVFRKPNSDALLEPVLDTDIPVVDFSILVAGDPGARARAVRDLGNACRDWGFFMVVNHGVPESLRNAMLDACKGFFDLTEEEKREYSGKNVMDSVRCGTSFNTAVEDIRYWRDFLKVFVHPDFNSPAKPAGFRETSLEYTIRIREVAKELLKGIWESLELETDLMEQALGMDSCFQIFAANLYPWCPQPELAIGFPPHSDFGLLTVIFQNGVDGLQIRHGGNWVRIHPIPNSFLVNTGDHLEIISNGRYKSVLHQAEVRGESTRMSIVSGIAPSMDALVAPAPKLVARDGGFVAYQSMKFREYLEHQQGNRLKEKSVLDLLRNTRVE